MNRIISILAALLMCSAPAWAGVSIDIAPTSTPGNTTPVYAGEITSQGDLFFVGSDIPGSAPTVSVNATAGNLTGSYRYRVTFVTADGETDPGIYSDAVSPSGEQVDLSAIPTGSSTVIARKIYRQIADAGVGSNLYYLAATISDNTTTTLTDNIADGSLGVLYPIVNTTSGSIYRDTYPFLRYGSTATFFGFNSGVNGTGYGNTGYGAYALYAATVGEYNTAIGRDSLRTTTTGSNNTAVGTSALFTNIDGISNTGIGVSALYSNTDGVQNTGVGRNAGYGTTTGDNNTTLGFGAGYRNATGSSNVMIGALAGYGASGANTSSNVFIGKEAGTAIAAGGDANVCIGTSACDALTTGDQNLVLGHLIDAPSATANGQLSIQNFIFGVGNTATGTTLSSGSMGVRNATPSSAWTVGTALDATTDYLQADTLNADTAGPPAAGDCDAATEVGRIAISSRYTATADNNLWVCLQTGAATFAWWKAALSAP